MFFFLSRSELLILFIAVDVDHQNHPKRSRKNRRRSGFMKRTQNEIVMLQPFQREAIDEYEEDTTRNKIMTGKKCIINRRPARYIRQ